MDLLDLVKALLSYDALSARQWLADAERSHERLLMADGALVRVGRDDRRVPHRLERLLEGEQPARLDAVVVRDQDSWPARPVAERLGNTPAVARGSYIDPKLLDRFRDGATIPLPRASDEKRVDAKRRARIERQVLALIE